MPLPDPDIVVSLQVEERGLLLLRESLQPGAGVGKDSLIGFAVQAHWPQYTFANAPTPKVDRYVFEQAMTEAFEWLHANLLIAQEARQSPNFVVITPKGIEVRQARDPLRAIEARKLLSLPLHERLEASRQAFFAGDYETAVFKAMRAVENAVKDASGITERLQPKALMTRAFKAGEGPLADTGQETAEQEGVMYLFMGAIGALRNPVGHREDLHGDPAGAAKIVIFADLLMDVVDRAVARGPAT